MSAWMKRALPRLLMALCALPTLAQAVMVRFETASGPIDINLETTAAQGTVNNFLAYVRGGDYNGMFLHRLARNANGTGFVLQGGGYTYVNSTLGAVTSRGAITNEFSATRSNLRGTVAMAKLGGSPNSATSEWFVNLGNNSANLDTQNGGFTVFGRVTTQSMVVVDQLASLTTINANGSSYTAFSELPVFAVPSGRALAPDDLVYVRSARELPTTAASDDDRVFNFLEANFPSFIPLKGSFGGTGQGYYFRHYPATNSYVGTKDGNIYYLVPAVADEIRLLGPLADWAGLAKSFGY